MIKGKNARATVREPESVPKLAIWAIDLVDSANGSNTLSDALESSLLSASTEPDAQVDLYKEALRILSQALTEGKIDLQSGVVRQLSTSEVLGVAKLFLKAPTPQPVNVNLFGEGEGG